MSSGFQTVFVLLLLAAFAASWEYGQQNIWYQEYPECGGMAQSPVDIKTSKVKKNNTTPLLRFVGYKMNINSENLELLNNGHTVQITPNTPRESTPYIRGGNLPGTFSLQSFHFHWGTKDNIGSEHTVNGKSYSMEAHLVHKNDKYDTMDEALQNPDGILVLGIFFKVSSRIPQASLRPIAEKLYEAEPDVPVRLDGDISIKSLFPIDGNGPYFTYPGSLTTPPCSEAVTWIVYRDYLPISDKEINQFRELFNMGVDRNNFRKVQPLNKRIIRYIYRR